MNFPKGLVRGKLKAGEALSAHTSFRIGGPAAFWVEPKDVKELKKVVLFARKNKVPVFVMGGGTNVLASDNGFNGIIIHLGAKAFKKLKVAGRTVTVGSGYPTAGLVRSCCGLGLSGMESLIGIPGTVGGAVYMNAGGWSSPLFKNIGDYVVSLKVMDRGGTVKTLKRRDIDFGYRSSGLSSNIIIEAVLRFGTEESSVLTSRCSKFLKMKKEKQVLDAPSAGCVFKNPQGSQFTTGQMIDTLGLKGRRIGGAEISHRHANFIVNKGGATCHDVMKLIGLVSRQVMDSYNIPLELEIKVI
jgi:UDP-N-acetylmuramate dehydrogenase